MMRLCAIPGCGMLACAKGYCRLHYGRTIRGCRIDAPLPSRSIEQCAAPGCCAPAAKGDLCEQCRAAIEQATAAARRRAIDYASALLADAHCIYTPIEAWHRACDADELPRSAVPHEVIAAASRRPSLREALDAASSSRPDADCTQDVEVAR